jgi:hypothetical protein
MATRAEKARAALHLLRRHKNGNQHGQAISVGRCAIGEWADPRQVVAEDAGPKSACAKVGRRGIPSRLTLPRDPLVRLVALCGPIMMPTRR